MSTPRLRYDPTVTLGNIISIVGFLAAITSYGLHLESRITSVEGTITTLQQQQIASETRNKDSDAELRVGMRRIDDKLTALLIQGYQTGRTTAPTPLHP